MERFGRIFADFFVEVASTFNFSKNSEKEWTPMEGCEDCWKSTDDSWKENIHKEGNE